MKLWLGNYLINWRTDSYAGCIQKQGETARLIEISPKRRVIGCPDVNALHRGVVSSRSERRDRDRTGSAKTG